MTAKRETAAQLWGNALREAREDAGIGSQEALGKLLFLSASLIGMWESGYRIPSVKQAKACDKVCGTGKHLETLRRDWVAREVSPEWEGKWLSIEEEATSINSFQPQVIPGLLQTLEYATAILSASNFASSDIEAKIQSRMDRQEILERENPPMLAFVIDENVIHRNIGGAKVMRDQLNRLLELAERPNIRIHIVPKDDDGVCSGSTPPFMIATVDGTEVVYQDAAVRGYVLEGTEDVAEFNRLWTAIRSEALNKQASIRLIKEVLEQWM